MYYVPTNRVIIVIRIMYVLFVAQLVAACNDGAKQLERTEQLVAIHKQIDFGKLKVHSSIMSQI